MPKYIDKPEEEPVVLKGSGGPGRGSGRTRGSLGKVSKEAIAQAKETGILPHEWLLMIVRGEGIEQKTCETIYDEDGLEVEKILRTEIIYPDLHMRIDAAKAAAPFYAPRLAVQTVSLKGGDVFAAAMQLVAERLPV